jgi:hypothetical protein
MRYLMVFIIAALSMATTCKKEAEPVDELQRKQTQCADPWGYGATEQETVSKLKDYLTKKEILVNALSMKATPEQAVCQACTCSNGFTFYVQADEQYIAALKLEGFQ